MEQNEKIIRYLEPIYRFCVNRLCDRSEAEDLAQEIMVHVLDGMQKYEIQSLDAWVWRIAHNRYARWIESRKTRGESVSDEFLYSIADERRLRPPSSRALRQFSQWQNSPGMPSAAAVPRCLICVDFGSFVFLG